MTDDDSTKIQERKRLARQQQEEEDAIFARSLQQPGQQQDEEEDDAKLARSLLAAETDDNEASPALPDRMMNQLLTQIMLGATCKNTPLLSQIRNISMPFGNQRSNNNNNDPPGWIQANSYRLPTLVDNLYHWIYTNGPSPYHSESVLGKWLIFSNPNHMDATWNKICPLVKSGDLHAHSAKVSTAFNNNASQQPQPKYKSKSLVICVYTCHQRVEEVGLKLIQVVQRNLHYKTDEATGAGLYASTAQEGQRVSSRNLYWNEGNPAFEKPPGGGECGKRKKAT
jgi:hypothetical protein